MSDSKVNVARWVSKSDWRRNKQVFEVVAFFAVARTPPFKIGNHDYGGLRD